MERLALPDDPGTAYAIAVDKGTISAGPHVRAACKRHIADLKRLPALGYRWDVAAVQRVIGYFADVLTVEVEEADGTSKAIPFILQPWQCFIIGSIFGWKNSKGLRRFRRAYIEIGKGNGKSPMAAGIGHYMLTATGKLRAEVYSAATDRDQAAILFRDAVAMWERSPELAQRLIPFGDKQIWQLTDKSTNSFFKPISSEKKGKSGVRPYCALVDEIHEHPDDSVIEMLRAGTKGNQQALLLEITNSGFDRESVCYKEHEYTIKVVHGDDTNEAWFGYISALDDGDDPFENEACWIKSNPNLGISIRLPYLREQVTEAKGMPSKESLVRRLHFCQWTDAEKTWIPRPMWEKLERNFKLEDYEGQPVCMGLDMSFTQDLTALAYVFPTGENTYDAFIDYWKPKDTIHDHAKRDGVDYPLWAKNNYLFLSEGKVIKLEAIARRIQWAMEKFDVGVVAYDKYRHKELESDLGDLSIAPPMIEHPQGFRRGPNLDEDAPVNVGQEDEQRPENPLWMPGSFEKLETAIIEERIRVALNPVTRWNVSCVVVRHDPSGVGNRIFDKRKSLGRIDGVVALAMAMGVATLPKKKPTQSIYELLAEQNANKPKDQTSNVIDVKRDNKEEPSELFSEVRRRWALAEDEDD